jgi:uncharacterized RDD family membrane protein YckC
MTGGSSGWVKASERTLRLVPGAPALRFADTGERFRAFLIDEIAVVILIVVALTAMAGLGLSDGTLLYAAALAVAMLYFVLSWTGGRRATIGQRLFKLQVGTFPEGRGLTIVQALKRWLALGYAISLLGVVPQMAGGVEPVLFIWQAVLLISTARSANGRGFHDEFANSAVARPLSADSSGGANPVAIGAVVVALLVLGVIGLIFLGAQVSSTLS